MDATLKRTLVDFLVKRGIPEHDSGNFVLATYNALLNGKTPADIEQHLLKTGVSVRRAILFRHVAEVIDDYLERV